MKKNKSLIVIAALVFFLTSFIYTFQQPIAKDVYSPFQRNYNSESNQVFNMVDEKGKSILKTSISMYVGDEYITQTNRRYKVTKVKGNTAYSKFVGIEDMNIQSENSKPTSSGNSVPAATQTKNQKIAIYHTHSDESYVPSDGSASIFGKGGIIQVGDALANSLKKKGFQVVHSTRSHDPHDANAYSRSRRTAFELLQKRPTAMIDVHRDATPPEVYRMTVAGQDVTGVKLVVGRQNPKMDANFAFAKRVKASADQTHPGLVTGIFLARGDYNQDLGNRSMLIEVGSHTNTKEEAERGAALFGDVMPKALQGSGTMAQAGPISFSPSPSEATGVFRAVLWVLGLAIVGGALFLWIATGSIKGSIEKLRQFKNVEFANYFGPKLKEKENLEDKKKEDK